MEELLSLKWNNHKSTFLHVLSILRDKQLYTDATIACEGKFYSVHKLVLSTCSDYFSAMLDRTNCKNPIIVLKDIKCEDLEALLDYMYLGEVNVRQGDLATLIKAAECLRVKGLAVPDDEPPTPSRKSKASDSQSRKRDLSRSPPAKRKRHNDVDDVRPVKSQNVEASPVHRPKSPVDVISSSPSPVQNRTVPPRPPPTTSKISLNQNSLHQDSSSTTVNSSEHKQSHDTLSSNPSDCFVKVEMDEPGAPEVETFDLSNEETFKEEGADDGATSAGGGGESVGDLSNDLPEFLQQATDPGAYGHSSFGAASSFPTNDMADWHGDGSNTGFSHGNFESAEGSSQQNAAGITSSISHTRSSQARYGGSGTSVTSLSSYSLDGVYSAADAYQGHGTLPQGRVGGGGSSRPRNHVCTFCLKSFYKGEDLRRHIRVHTGERPYSCPCCPYRSARKGNLKQHLRIHEKHAS